MTIFHYRRDIFGFRNTVTEFQPEDYGNRRHCLERLVVNQSRRPIVRYHRYISFPGPDGAIVMTDYNDQPPTINRRLAGEGINRYDPHVKLGSWQRLLGVKEGFFWRP